MRTSLPLLEALGASYFFACSLPPPGQSSASRKHRADMARMFMLSCLVACCAALQPSQMLSTRTAQAGQRTAAPVMKRSDYFLRVSRSEAGRPRLCVFRWASAATN